MKGSTAIFIPDDIIRDDPVDRMSLALAGVAGEDRSHWPGSALSERVVELLELRERLDAELLRLVGEWDRNRAWEIDGALSGGSWLAHRTPVPREDAQRLVKTARLVDCHPATATALADGDVTAPQVSRMSRAVTKERLPLFTEHEAALLNAAKDLPFGDFAKVVRRWAHLVDDELGSDDHEQLRERRRLNASVTFGGWGAGDFLLDPDGIARLLTALDELAPPDPADRPAGERTLAQRRADALVELADQFLRGTQPAGRAPVSLNVIVDVATLNGDSPDLVRGRCEIEGVGPVTRATLDRLACDASLTRIVMAGGSVVLDMGRSARLATPKQRRALAIRDGGCRFPGCSRPPDWCDAHHIESWVRGGQTDLDELVLLCRRHHVLLHETGWTTVRLPSGEFEFVHPDRTHDPPVKAA